MKKTVKNLLFMQFYILHAHTDRITIRNVVYETHKGKEIKKNNKQLIAYGN